MQPKNPEVEITIGVMVWGNRAIMSNVKNNILKVKWKHVMTTERIVKLKSRWHSICITFKKYSVFELFLTDLIYSVFTFSYICWPVTPRRSVRFERFKRRRFKETLIRIFFVQSKLANPRWRTKCVNSAIFFKIMFSDNNNNRFRILNWFIQIQYGDLKMFTEPFKILI